METDALCNKSINSHNDTSQKMDAYRFTFYNKLVNSSSQNADRKYWSGIGIAWRSVGA